jgi:hypothetical protein
MYFSRYRCIYLNYLAPIISSPRAPFMVPSPTLSRSLCLVTLAQPPPPMPRFPLWVTSMYKLNITHTEEGPKSGLQARRCARRNALGFQVCYGMLGRSHQTRTLLPRLDMPPLPAHFVFFVFQGAGASPSSSFSISGTIPASSTTGGSHCTVSSVML